MDARETVLAELRNENTLREAGKAAQDRGEPTVVQDALYEAADAARGRKLAAFGELRLAARARLAGVLAVMFAAPAMVALAVLPAPALAWGEQSPRVLTFQAWDFQGRLMMDERREFGSVSACEREAGALVEHARQRGYSFTWRCDPPGHGSLSADNNWLDNWPDSWNHPGQPAAACKHPDGGEGLVPCCNDVTAAYSGKCGIERPEAPTMPKVPFKPAGETAGLRRP